MGRINFIKVALVAFFMTILGTSMPIMAQNTPLPYFNGFENTQDTAGWTLKKRIGKAGFVFGTATHCLGYKSMYISPDSGQTATYTGGSYVSIAYKSFTLPAGTYQLAFDYQLGGDGTNQDMKVAWSPASTTLSTMAMGSYPNNIVLNQFTDTLSRNTFGIAAWTHVTGTVTVPAGGGTYNLCFAFRSNNTTVSTYGACVDNIQLDTVKTSSDCSKIPSNIQVVKDSLHGVIITWSGAATQYEVIAASASDPLDNSYCRHTGITNTTDTMQYSELNEGQYFIYVRAICNGDTSMFGEIYGVLIYDASEHCIDFIAFNSPTTRCTYGTYSNPYQTNGYIDQGPSSRDSRHTVHTDLNEMDPRTNNSLHTVPAGELMSVRLGNWYWGAEAESITYTYNVPTGSSLILMMKYAIVFEAANHSEPPEFKLEIMNVNNQLLDATCTKANFQCNGTLSQGWHTSTYQSSTIRWKEWTTIGVNLTQYAGQTIKIRLTTYDCNFSEHFGYAYFTLDCQNAEITGVSCGSGGFTEMKAPDGFNYSWTNNCTGQVLSTAQTLSISCTDTCLYTCTCTFKEQASCSFTLTAQNIFHLPESSFSYFLTYSDCQAHITFLNNSQVYMIKNGVKTFLPNEQITSQIWNVNTNDTNRLYYNMTSTANDFCQIDIPNEGDTITVTLTSYLNGFVHDTTLIIYVPALQSTHDITERYVCQGTPVSFNQKTYTFINQNTVEVVTSNGNRSYIIGQQPIQVIDTLSSLSGCDSISELRLSALITEEIYIDTATCISNFQPYHLQIPGQHGEYVIDTCIATTGNYIFHVPSSIGCDSLLVFCSFAILDSFNICPNVNDTNMGYVTGCGTYCEGETVTLTAVANRHFYFVSWSDGQTSPTITVRASYISLPMALFEADAMGFHVSVLPNYADRGIVTGSGQYNYMDYVTVTASPNSGFEFKEWSNGVTDRTFSFYLISDTTLIANFDVPGAGLDETRQNSELTLFPNPVHTGETILINGNFSDEELNGMTVEVIDMNGMVVRRNEANSSPVEIEGVDVAGAYIVRITAGTGKVYTQKLIVK